MQLQSDRNTPGNRVSALVLGLLGLGLLLGLGCARQGIPVMGSLAPDGSARVQIQSNGLSRVQLTRGRQTQPWDSVALRNAGAASIRQIKFWDAGRASLLLAPRGSDKPSVLYTPFSLLPGEVLALSATAASKQVFGILDWQTPRDPDLARGSIMRGKQATLNADGSITLIPGTGDAWVQFELSAPLGYERVRIAWDAEPVPVEPQLWLNLDGDFWIRVGRTPDQPRVDWLHPADLTKRLGETRRFWIRLAYEVPAKGSNEAGSALAQEKLVIRRIRIDREVAGPGLLRAWGPGSNTFELSVQAKEKPDLEIRLNGKK